MGSVIDQLWPGWTGPGLLVLGLLLMAGLLGLAGPAGRSGDGGGPLETALLVLPGGEELVVELAVSPAQRRRGLMYRDELPAGQGMLLVFPDTGFRSIWMKNVRFPLDLIWLDSSDCVVHIEKDVPPCPGEPCPDYHSMRKAAAVLELNAGSVARWGIEHGDHLEFIPPVR